MNTALPPDAPIAEVRRRDSWFVFALAALVVVVIAGRTTTSPSVWTDLVVGRAIWASGIPRTDIFTFTGAGERWLDIQWLYHAALGLLWRMGGAKMVGAATVACVAAAFTIVLWPDWRTHGASALISVALLMWLGAGRWQTDPAIFAIVPAAVMALALRQASMRRRYGLAIPAQLAWINMDPSGVAGPLLAAAGAVAEEWAYWRGEGGGVSRCERAARFGLPLVLLATLAVQPYGAAGLGWAYEHRRQLFGVVFEERSLPSLLLAGAPPTAPLAFYVSAALCALALALCRRPAPARESLMALGGLALGMLSARWMAAMVVSVAPLLAWAADALGSEHGRRRRRAGIGVVWVYPHAMAFVAAAAAAWLGARQAARSHPLSSWGLGIESRLQPVGASTAIAERGLSPRLYCSPSDGAWLAWALEDASVFADLRPGCRAAAEFDPRAWLESGQRLDQAIISRWGLDTALLSCIHPSGLAIANRWLEDRRWQLIYFDGISTILALRGSDAAARWGADERLQQMGLELIEAEAAAIEAALADGRRPPPPVRLIGAAAFYEATGRWPAAAAALELAARAYPEAGLLVLHLARARWRVGDRAGAKAALERYLRREPRSELARELEKEMQAADRPPSGADGASRGSSPDASR